MKKLAAVVFCSFAQHLAAATFTVTNTDDTGPGSLRQAILDANANPGFDTIAFDIPGAGVHTIIPATVLPSITDPALVDGYSQPGSSPNTDPAGFNGTLLIELSGTAAPMNGLVVSAGGSTIRGLVINRFMGLSTDTGNAIFLNGAGGNHIEGNFIGTDPGGTLAQGNEDTALIFGSDDNVLGGTTPEARNVISATGRVALFVVTSGNVIQGNFIGTQRDGVSPLGNLSGIGFVGGGFADNNTIGGTEAGEANVIAFNDIHGVVGEFAGFTGNSIRGNSIHDNGALGIDNGTGGPHFNDALDADDGGPNRQQNFPIIQSVEHQGPQGAGTRIVGKLGSAPSTTYDLDFYANPVCSNFPREFIEGQTWLGESEVTTDGNGAAAFDVTFPVATEAGARISATATDPAGNTSEFSQRIIFSIGPVSGPDTGGTGFNVFGTDFADPTTISVGGVPATGVSFFNDHQLSAVMPALAPGTSNDILVTTPDGTTGTLIKGWVADFLDVPGSHQFYSFVTTLVSNGITAGVGGGNYGVAQDTLRQQMAVFLLKAKYGLCYTPPPCTVQVFDDVPCSLGFSPWINELVAQNIATGCAGGNNYCPGQPVLRQQMAVLLLRTLEGPAYVPPQCTVEAFTDVPCSSPFAPWINELVARAITGGCGGGLYCPASSANRGQMAVFVVKTFGLQ